MVSKLTKAQASLVRLMKHFTPRHLSASEADRFGLRADFERVRRAGLIVSAGYETTVEAEDWLNTDAGRVALATEQTP